MIATLAHRQPPPSYIKFSTSHTIHTDPMALSKCLWLAAAVLCAHGDAFDFETVDVNGDSHLSTTELIDHLMEKRDVEMPGYDKEVAKYFDYSDNNKVHCFFQFRLFFVYHFFSLLPRTV